ncbi:unnamed protein product [Sphagnum tenellum]
MHSDLQAHPSTVKATVQAPVQALIHATQRLGELNPDQFEVYYEHRTSTRIDSKDQEIDTLTRTEDVGLAIRIIKDPKARV